jgi:hypothetical protein
MLKTMQSILRRWLVAAAFAIGLAACGGGGGGMSGGTQTAPQGCTASTCGNAMLTLTDAPGDFASYTVNVTSLQLQKADGTMVETLPVSTTVDFTQLVDITELVTAAQIPQGEYVAATMTLDYTNASIYVYTDAADTQSVQVAEVMNGASGGGILWPAQTPPQTETVTLSVQLDNAHHLFINPGKLSRLALDFNLAASNTVDLTNPAQPVVTVKPLLVASVVPSDTKSTRVRGPLVSVDQTQGSYVVTVQPFNNSAATSGQVTVLTTPQTTFEVDGKSLNQANGLSALSADGAGTLTVAFGTLSTTDMTFTATEVLAGSSVQSGNFDRVQGVVISRSTVNGVVTLIVRGGTILTHADGDCRFSPKDVAVQIGANTMVSAVGAEPGSAPALSWPSVGSEITAFGTATTTTDASGRRVFDATAGALRVERTTLWGTAASTGIAAGQVTLNLQAIEGLPVATFDFTGTGSNPASYVVAIGALPPPPTPLATAVAPLRFFGLVQPFGFAPPDFNAETLISFADTSALLDAGFGAGSTAALTVTGTASLTLNVSDPLLGPMHFIKIGPQLINLLTLTSNVMIVPDPTSSGPFAIRTMPNMGSTSAASFMIDVYNNFPDFATQLSTKLAGGAKVQQVLAIGQYDQSTNTLTAEQIDVGLD